MSSTHSASSRGYAVTLAFFASACLLAGCATSSHRQNRTEQPVAPAPPAATQPSEPASIAVVRYSRYTLVETSPLDAQADLMQQVIDVTMPPSLTSTVRDALHYVLIRSGYRLCDRDDNRILGTLPLPAAHMRLGPMTLRNVLQVLVGPAWVLEVDDMARQACFHQHLAQSPDASKAVAPNLDPSAPDAVTTATVSQPQR